MNHSETITIECTINGMPFSFTPRQECRFRNYSENKGFLVSNKVAA